MNLMSKNTAMTLKEIVLESKKKKRMKNNIKYIWLQMSLRKSFQRML